MSGGPRLGTDAVRWLARRQVRARGTALGTLALVVALGATASLVAAGAADRTARAYGHYVESAEVGDVVINPSLATTEVDRLIRDLPGVRSVTTDALLLATLGDGAPATPTELTGATSASRCAARPTAATSPWIAPPWPRAGCRPAPVRSR
jgi:hypothetical protein